MFIQRILLPGLYLSSSVVLAATLALPSVKVTPKKVESLPSTSSSTPSDASRFSKGHVTIPLTNHLRISPQLKQSAHVNFISGGRRFSQLPVLRGLSGSQILVEIDGVPNPFSHFSHYSMRLSPPIGFLKSVEIRQAGDSAKGSGAIGGSLSFNTSDPALFLNSNQAISTELTQSFQSGAPGVQSSVAVSAKSSRYQGLFKVQGNISGDIQTGNGQTLSHSAQRDLHYLAKLKFQATADQSLNFSMLSLQNWGQYPALINSPISLSNPLSELFLQQSQQQLSYCWKPEDLRFDFNLKLYHLSTHQSLKPILESPSTQSSQRLSHRITLNMAGFDLDNLQPLSNTKKELLQNQAQAIYPLRKQYGDRNRDKAQDEKQSLLGVNEHRSPSLTTSSNARRPFAAGLMSDISHIHYGLQASIQTGEDAIKSATYLNYPSGVQRRQAALFAKTLFKLSPKLQILSGLRLDHSGHTNGVESSQLTRLNKQLEVIIKTSPHWQLQARYAEALRFPSLDELYLGGIHPKAPNSRLPNIRLKPNPSLKPEMSAYKEVGIQYSQQDCFQTQDLFDWKVHVFLNNLENYISYVKLNDASSPQDIIFQNQNIGPVMIYGTSLSLSYTQANQIRWTATGSIAQGYNLSDYSGLGGTVLKGTSLPNLPPVSAMLGLVWPLSKVHGELQIQAQAAMGNASNLKGYHLWDVYYRWTPPIQGLEVCFSVENILNTYYEIVPNVSTAQSRTPLPIPAMGRNFSIMIRYCI